MDDGYDRQDMDLIIGPDEYYDEQYACDMRDGRFCTGHPGVRISSQDGRFDAPCHLCEAESDQAHERELWLSLSPQEKHAAYEQLWAVKQENKRIAEEAKLACDDECPF